MMTYVKSTDGYNFVIDANYFLSILKMEQSLGLDVINLKVSDVNKVKIKTIVATQIQAILSKHSDVYINLKKESTVKLTIHGFLFDSYILNDISFKKNILMRNFLRLGTHGHFISFKNITQMRIKELTPFYARLLPIKKNVELLDDSGMLIIKQVYK